MRDNFHAGVNVTWYSVLFDHKLTKLFSIKSFSGAKHAGKVLIIFIIVFLIITQSGEQVLLLVSFRIYARRIPKGPEEAPIFIVQSERTTNSRRKMKGNVFKF